MKRNFKKLMNVICNKKYTNEDIKVRDHCHITGKYRGSAHQDCNLKLRIKPEEIKIPVIFHNLRGYDSHFIMQEIVAIVKKNTYKNKKGKEKQMNINAIPNNMEKHMAFMLGSHLVFLDSFQFMSSGLEKLVSNLPRKSLKYTSQKFKGKKLDLMARKGVYPYDYMDSFDKFNKKLPMKEEFYSVLNNEHISDEDYKHTQNVWNTFSLKNMGEYHDLYLKSDILLLADVFENFRKTCLEYYKLDPCHYFTSPGLSWDAMLKMTKIKLELMTDIDMFQFIEKGLRGGISYIANRYGKANNKYMKEYNEKAPSKYIMYLDANNLYGWAMSQYLPTGGFRWMTQKQIDKTNLAKYEVDSKKGLILELGKFKDEAAGVPICEFVGLRSKMYSYIKDNQKGGKTAKGIKKNVIKKDIQHENYKETLFNNKQMYHKMKTIRSESHQLGSYEINKVSLSCFDDKRYILDDGKTSYAYGHKDINLVYQ